MSSFDGARLTRCVLVAGVLLVAVAACGIGKPAPIAQQADVGLLLEPVDRDARDRR